MKADRIIGRVGANVLFLRLTDSKQGDRRSADSKALFRLDQLAPNQIASIVREILANPVLSAIVDLRIPASLVVGENLPTEALTDQNAGAARNASTNKEALLTANGHGQNLSDTLGYVTALGAKEFKDNEDAWVEATCHVGSIAPTQDDRLVFKAALRALIASQDLSLVQLADFCEMIIEGNAVRGEPIREAIGWALPCVGLPRDSSYFSNPKSFGQAYLPWRKAFEKLFASRRTLLERLKPTGQPMDAADMLQRLDENSAAIDAGVRVTLEAFINAPVGNFSVAEEVALLEWEKDGVHFIFEKPRERQLGLADSTLMFFDHDCTDTDVLTLEWRKHLDDLKARERRSDWNEDDEVFFELHRRYIESNKNLHARWEKVVFGDLAPIPRTP